MVTIKIVGSRLSCITPYHPDFPNAARDIGGRWVAPAWDFDARDEQRVRDLCLDLWGTDGTPCELVTLRCVAGHQMFDSVGTDCELYLAGRLVAKVFGKNDVRAKLGDGVVITSGRFHGSGSLKNPSITWSKDIAFELRDVPLAAAERARSDWPSSIEIIASPMSPAPESVKVDPARQALINERASLLMRLAMIDIELAKFPAQSSPRVYEVAHELRDEN